MELCGFIRYNNTEVFGNERTKAQWEQHSALCVCGAVSAVSGGMDAAADSETE